VTISRLQTTGEVRIFNALDLGLPPEVIPVGIAPGAIALTPNGKTAVVANRGENTISIIDTASKSVQGQGVSVGAGPFAVAVSPDGARAYVAKTGDNTISIVDLTRREVVDTIQLAVNMSLTGTMPLSAFALTPTGDKIYVGVAGKGSLLSIPIGARSPAEWGLTSGSVTPVCLREPFHLAAVLGKGPHEPDLKPTTLSQVVPVAESCLYEFSFFGIATQPDAVAELFWLGQDCRLLSPEPDPVPIKALDISSTTFPTALNFVDAIGSVTSDIEPVLHRIRETSPAGAAQAEIRFSVPEGALALITEVSLAGTTEALSNADLSLVKDGVLVDWAIASATATGVSLVAAEGGIQIRNASAGVSELVQAAEAKGGQPFKLEFQGQTVAQRQGQTPPSLKIFWLKADGKETGEHVTLDLSSTGFDSAVATGDSPPDATKAEIHLSVPAGTTQEVKRISLRFTPTTNVPVRFISQAPGELTVSDMRIAFEDVTTSAPRIHAEGLCKATLPGRRPGAENDDHSYCPCCEGESEMTDKQPVKTEAGRPAMLGRCANCGTDLLVVGGAHIIDAQVLPLARISTHKAVVHFLAGNKEIQPKKMDVEIAQEPLPPELTDITGIGQARAEQLAAIGIESVAALASASPDDVVKLKGVSLKLAAQMIAQAQELIAAGEKP
jgi:YVTN family beta-propeller protein